LSAGLGVGLGAGLGVGVGVGLGRMAGGRYQVLGTGRKLQVKTQNFMNINPRNDKREPGTGNREQRTTRWGLIGPGKIAHKFAQGLASVKRARLLAVASRSEDRAQEFAKQYKAPFFYQGYESIVRNPDVDIIYIATPHTFHFENALMCLGRGKPVLCEKPFTLTRKQLQILVDTAKNNKVFLMEAIWTRFLPTIQKIIEIRDSGEFGPIRAIYADFGFRAPVDFEGRLYNLKLGGGALLDIGIYPVFLSLLLLGKPSDIKSTAVIAKTGADESCSMIFSYDNGAIANLACTFTLDTPIEANIIFEKGRIRINRRWFAPSSLVITDSNEKSRELTFRYNGNGYHFEAEEAMKCLENGMIESPQLPLDFSLELMGLLDEIRRQCGIHYPGFEEQEL
jgi:predicted dehydrogenase